MGEKEKKILLPTEEECKKMWELCQTPQEVQEHCAAVSRRAIQLGMAVQANGYVLNLELIEQAALLHDVLRHHKDHAREGALLLQRMGYTEVAAIIECHHEFRDSQWEKEYALEAAIVYLADKQMQGVNPVNVTERFEKSRERIIKRQDAKEALEYHERRYRQAKEVEQRIAGLLCGKERIKENEINKDSGCRGSSPLP